MATDHSDELVTTIRQMANAARKIEPGLEEAGTMLAHFLLHGLRVAPMESPRKTIAVALYELAAAVGNTSVHENVPPKSAPILLLPGALMASLAIAAEKMLDPDFDLPEEEAS